MSDTEQEDLESLVKSPGWLTLMEHAKREWVTGYPLKVKTAIAEARATKHSAEVAVQCIDAASDAVNALLTWPTQRLQQLQHAQMKRPSSYARGGL